MDNIVFGFVLNLSDPVEQNRSHSSAILKGDLVVRLQQGFSQHMKKDLETVVDVVFDAMISALKEKRRVEIRGIGSFSLHSA